MHFCGQGIHFHGMASMPIRFLYCIVLLAYLIDCSEQLTSQRSIALSTRERSSEKPSTGHYESLNTLKPDVVVYDHVSPSTESASGNRDPLPTLTSYNDYEDLDAAKMH